MKTKLNPTQYDLLEQTRGAMLDLLNQRLAEAGDIGTASPQLLCHTNQPADTSTQRGYRQRR